MDTTWGGQLSDAYVDLTSANSYITTAVFDSADWTSATSAQQNTAIVEATIQIDRGIYRGERYYSTQKLQFPRSLNGMDYTSVGTPSSISDQQQMDDVRRACALQALHVCRNAGRDLHAERIAAGIRHYSEKIGPINESTQYGGAVGSNPTPQRLSQDVLDILAKWRTSRRIRRA